MSGRTYQLSGYAHSAKIEEFYQEARKIQETAVGSKDPYYKAKIGEPLKNKNFIDSYSELTKRQKTIIDAILNNTSPTIDHIYHINHEKNIAYCKNEGLDISKTKKSAYSPITEKNLAYLQWDHREQKHILFFCDPIAFLKHKENMRKRNDELIESLALKLREYFQISIEEHEFYTLFSGHFGNWTREHSLSNLIEKFTKNSYTNENDKMKQFSIRLASFFAIESPILKTEIDYIGYAIETINDIINVARFADYKK